MGIKDMENSLFEEWAKNRSGFVKDGVVDEDAYLKSSPKLVFILKEVNDPDGGGWDLRKYIRNGARPQTWNNITRWTYGIQNIKKDISWSELQQITEEQRKSTLKSICVINLKKSPGGSTTDNDILAKEAREDKIFLKRQFSLYNPDLVICCGKGVSEIFCELMDLPPGEWKMTKRGIRYYEYTKKKYVVEFFHPQARVASHLLYYSLIDAIREIF